MKIKQILIEFFDGCKDTFAKKSSLSTVATTGSYDDLEDKPNLSQVATTGDYNDLENKPSIPTKTSDLENDGNGGTPLNPFVTIDQVAQSDWNENDVTKPSFIKNRICYEMEEQQRGYSNTDTDYTVIDDWNFYSMPNIDENFVNSFVGRTVSFEYGYDGERLSWNAEVQLNESPETSGDLYKWSSGNVYAIYGPEDYDWIVFILEDNTDINGTTFNKGFIILNYLYGDCNYTISNKTVTTIKTIDEKYLPEGIGVQSDWNENDSSSKSFIKNRICYEGESTTTHYDIFEIPIVNGSLQGQDSSFSSYYFFNFPEGFEPKDGETYIMHVKDKEAHVTWSWTSGNPSVIWDYNGGGTIYINTYPSAAFEGHDHDYSDCKYYITCGCDGTYYTDGTTLNWSVDVVNVDKKVIDHKWFDEGVIGWKEKNDMVGHNMYFDNNGTMEDAYNGYYWFNPTQKFDANDTYVVVLPEMGTSFTLSQGATSSTAGSGGGGFSQGSCSFYWDDNGLSGAPNGETAKIWISGNSYFFKNTYAKLICSKYHTIDPNYSGVIGWKGTGTNSTIFNYKNNVASGSYSFAEGSSTQATGNTSHAEGQGTQASGDYSHTEGYNTISSGYTSHAEGSSTIAIGNYSHVEGYNTIAKGAYSHAEGYGYGSTSFTGLTYVSTNQFSKSGNYSSSILNGYIFRFGDGSTTYPYRYGVITNVSYNSSTGITTFTLAETILSNDTWLGRGYYYKNGVASGENSHVEGHYNLASGQYSHAEGSSTQANGRSSHAEGGSTTANAQYSHAEGYMTKSVSDYSHAEGYYTQSNGQYSHAEGGLAQSNGQYSHAEGYYTTSSGNSSHAEGQNTYANGLASHAEGVGIKATHAYQHAFGEFNALDPSTASSSSRGTYVEIVGNGTNEQTRSNARTLDWNGNEWVAGTITSQGKRVALMYEIEQQDVIVPNAFNDCGSTPIGSITLATSEEVPNMINKYQGVLVSNGSLTIYRSGSATPLSVKANIDLTSLDANEIYLFSIIGCNGYDYYCAINKFA